MSSAALQAAHQFLDEVLARFRELVVAGDGARAAAVLAAYRALTAGHAAAEEELLIADRVGGRWPPELYVGQHGKLLAAIDRVAALVPTLTGGPGWRRQALVILDAAGPLVHLAEHHHAAEEQDLFVTAAPAALAEVAARFAASTAAVTAVLAEADRALAAPMPG